MCEQIPDGDGQVVVGVHQPCGGRDDAVPVRVGVVGEGDAVPILEADEPGHRVWARAVHANLAVVIHGHEREGRVDLRVHHVDIHAIGFVDRPPVMHRRAAERVHPQLEAGGADCVHVDDVPQVLDIGQDEVLSVRGRCLDRRRQRHAFDPGIAAQEQLVGPVLDPFRDIGIGRAAVGRVVLEAAILRGIVRRRDDDAIRRVLLAAAIIHEDGPRDDRRRRDAVVGLDDRRHPVGCQHLQRGALRRPGQRVRVLAHVERTVRAMAATVIADGLADGQDVGFGERAQERCSPVPAGAEGDELKRIRQIRAVP